MLPSGVELEAIACPVGCPPSDRELLQSKDRLGGRPGLYRVVKCLTCGLMRTDPRPTPDSMAAYYGEDYGPYADQAIPAPAKASLRSRFVEAVRLDTRRLPPIRPGRMLELGCSTGEYMRFAQQLGWDVEGIEFSDVVADVARTKGLKVQASTVENASPPTQPYDLVVGWMVLEHLHEPVRALSLLRSWTVEQGYLIFSVPDAGSLERRLFGDAWYALQVPTHLYHFTPRTIRKVLSAAGWNTVRVQWQPNPNNLLMSLSYKFDDWRLGGLANGFRNFAKSPRSSLPRMALGWLLALFHQSGRMEIWAQPVGAPATTSAPPAIAP